MPGAHRPLVLVSARWAGVMEGRERPGVFAPRTLVDAISRAGGEPVLAWPDSQERAAALVAAVDAVVLQGGTIHQHYDESSVAHGNNPHDVDVVPGTLLEEVMGGGARSGWSNHQQALFGWLVDAARGFRQSG